MDAILCKLPTPVGTHRLLQPHTLVAVPCGPALQVGEGHHVSLDQPPFCTLPSQATVR